MNTKPEEIQTSKATQKVKDGQNMYEPPQIITYAEEDLREGVGFAFSTYA